MIESVQLVPNPEGVALVHDWLTTYVGGERVFEQMIAQFPLGKLYTSIDILPEHERGFLGGRIPVTSFVQNWPFVRKRYKSFLPLMILAMEQLDVSEHELVLSSSSAIAKGVLTGPDQLHISYVHSPMRYAWDLQHQYLREAGLDTGIKGYMAKWLLSRARIWDARTANGVDHFVANSKFIARRIWKTYRREAKVIYPPVDIDRFTLRQNKDDFYLVVSRMVPYKRVPAVIDAFKFLPDQRLVVIGDGSEMKRARQLAGKNVEILGYQPGTVVVDLMQRAKGFVFAGEEDFGISLVEAQACGTPVIALARGGACETIRGHGREGRTGHFFHSATSDVIASAIREFESCRDRIHPIDCRLNAERFSVNVFHKEFAAFVAARWVEFRGNRDKERPQFRYAEVI